MKKFYVLVLVILFLPLNIYALKITTNVTGIEEVNKGDNVIYTVIIDRPLNNYKAEISYDKEALNLVDVKEVNVNTTTKTFNVEKSDTIVIDSNSTELSNIIYTIEFKVKSYSDVSNTTINIKTLVSNSTESKYTPDEVDVKILINDIEEDDFSSTSIISNDKKFKSTLDNIKDVFKNYGNTVLYVSLGLNVILFIALIANIRRKKVDYDF